MDVSVRSQVEAEASVAYLQLTSSVAAWGPLVPPRPWSGPSPLPTSLSPLSEGPA